MSYPNRFKGLKYVNVNALRISFFVGCLFNVLLAAVVLAIVGIGFFFISSTEAQQLEAVPTSPPRSLALLPTLTPFPTSTGTFTPTIEPTSTTWPTLTPLPTYTPVPTLIPLATSTPFTFTIVFSQPLPTATRLYSLGELLGGASLPPLYSQYKYGFYRAVCLSSGASRIEPRVVGLPEIIPGLHWRLWNDYGYVADTSDYEESYSDDTTIFLSSNPSQFHLGLFYFDQRISDQILIDYPGQCSAVQVIYGVAARSAGGGVVLSGSAPISQTEVVSVAIVQ